MAALTLYYTKLATTTLNTAGNLTQALGGSFGTTATTLGNNTGFGEIASINPVTWSGAGTIGNPSGKGFLWDYAQHINLLAGNWTHTIRLQITGAGVTGTLTFDLHARDYMRSAGGIYTQIGSDIVLSNQTMTTTATGFATAPTHLPQANLSPADRYYTDVWCNVTANNTAGGTALITMFSALTLQGVATASIVTPGFQIDAPMSTVSNRGFRSNRGRAR